MYLAYKSWIGSYKQVPELLDQAVSDFKKADLGIEAGYCAVYYDDILDDGKRQDLRVLIGVSFDEKEEKQAR